LVDSGNIFCKRIVCCVTHYLWCHLSLIISSCKSCGLFLLNHFRGVRFLFFSCSSSIKSFSFLWRQTYNVCCSCNCFKPFNIIHSHEFFTVQLIYLRHHWEIKADCYISLNKIILNKSTCVPKIFKFINFTKIKSVCWSFMFVWKDLKYSFE